MRKLSGHLLRSPLSLRGFHRGVQKGFQIPNESCDCIKYLNLGEFLITVMSSLSQEESRSISENVRWGMRKKMQDGKYSVVYSHFLGYDRGPDGGMVINHNEAKVVKYIYRSCLQGYSDTAIAKRLMELGVPAPYGGERWHPAVVWNMLSNEKMKGDALIQKSYVADFLTKRQKKNKGEVPSYYVSGGHEAIIEPGLFGHVQKVRRDRNEEARPFTGIRPWASKLICGKCGNYFRIKKRHGHACWECRDSYKKENPCKNTYIYEEARNILVKELMAEVLGRRPGVVKKMKEIIRRVVTDPERREEIKRVLSGMRDAEQLLPDDDDLLMVLQSIKIFPDNHIEAELIDGERISRKVRVYSPGRGWSGE